MEEWRLTGWIGARNNGVRTSEVRKSPILLRIVDSISTRNPDTVPDLEFGKFIILGIQFA
jgi:hypothetical protein